MFWYKWCLCCSLPGRRLTSYENGNRNSWWGWVIEIYRTVSISVASLNRKNYLKCVTFTCINKLLQGSKQLTGLS
jgi:hypothetical protein